MKDGLLIVNKPGGMTSHDVVDRFRLILHERRIGHTGTLDPDATGVLVLAVARATRLIPFLPLDEKEYRARIKLGISTDSHDASGRPVGPDRSDRPPSEEDLSEALQEFSGDILQVPPMVSALKVGGRRLYQLARRGVQVPRPPRPVRIDLIELLDYRPPLAEVQVVCSAGTYIRSLARDLGEKLGTGAHLAGLVRTRVGPYGLDGALPESDWERVGEDNFRAEVLVTPQAALGHMPSWVADPDLGRLLADGRRINPPESGAGFSEAPDGLIAVHSESGGLIAVARKTTESSGEVTLSPVRVLYRDDRARAGS